MGLKTLARAVIPQRQYEQLSVLKNRLLGVAPSLDECCLDLFNRPESRRQFLNGLPDSVKLAIKTELEIVGKLDYDQQEILLAIESAIEYGIRTNSCKKEPETVQWIETLIREGDVLYDVGANVGAYSLVAAKFFNHKVKVYAFEPSFVNFAQLCKNVVLNRCSDCLYPLQIGLSDRTGVETFNYQNLDAGGALSALGKPYRLEGR